MDESNHEKEHLIKTRRSNSHHEKRRVLYVLSFISLLYYFGGVVGSFAIKNYTYTYLDDQRNGNISNLTSVSMKLSSPKCVVNGTSSEGSVQKEASRWNMYYEYAEFSISVIVVVFCGVLSDYYGRKPFIVLPLFGHLVENVVAMLVVYFELDVIFFLIGYGFTGLCGTVYTLGLATCACLADTSAYDKSRSFLIALISLFIGIAAGGAQFLSGYLIDTYGIFIPCLIGTSSIGLSFLVAVMFMPETLVERKTKKDSLCTMFFKLVSFYTGSSHFKTGNVWTFIFCIFAFAFVLTPLSTRSNILLIHLLGEPFCFSSKTIASILAAQDIIMMTLATGVLKVMHICMSDESVMMFGCLSGIACFVLQGLATEWWMFYIAAGLGIIMINPIPVIKGILSRMVDESRQGSLFANIYALENFCRLFGATVFYNIYAETQSFMKGFVFLVYAGFTLCALFFMIPVLVSYRRKHHEEKEIILQTS